MSEYINTYVMRGKHAYRVAFYTPTRRPMIVCRKTKHDETVMRLDGPTGAAVVEAARRQIWPAAAQAKDGTARSPDPLREEPSNHPLQTLVELDSSSSSASQDMTPLPSECWGGVRAISEQGNQATDEVNTPSSSSATSPRPSGSLPGRRGRMAEHLTAAQRAMLIASGPDDITGREGHGVELRTGADYAVAKALERRDLGHVEGPGGPLCGLYFNNETGMAWRREEVGGDPDQAREPECPFCGDEFDVTHVEGGTAFGYCYPCSEMVAVEVEV